MRRIVLTTLDQDVRFADGKGRPAGVAFFGGALTSSTTVFGTLLIAFLSAYLIGAINEFGMTGTIPARAVSQLNWSVTALSSLTGHLVLALLVIGGVCYGLGYYGDVQAAQNVARLVAFRQADEQLTATSPARSSETEAIRCWLGLRTEK